MSTTTTNYGWILPGVGDPTDQDLWGGYLNSNLVDQDTVVKAISDSVAAAGQLPVGSLYINATDNTNPATLLGYGTWVSLGAGRVLIGVGTGTDGNGDNLVVAAGDTGGEYNHELTTDEIPLHGHPFRTTTAVGTLGESGMVVSNSGTPTSYPAYTGGAAGNAGQQIGGTGGGQGHNNIQPYIGVYIWRRTV